MTVIDLIIFLLNEFKHDLNEEIKYNISTKKEFHLQMQKKNILKTLMSFA